MSVANSEDLKIGSNCEKKIRFCAIETIRILVWYGISPNYKKL